MNSNIENYPVPNKKYKVLVRCMTYNQSKFIEDALYSFAMQQTDFPFVCLIMDDASTDDEQDVIKRWMEKECDITKAEYIEIPTSLVVIVPHKSNLNCTFAFYLLKHNLWTQQEEKGNHINPWREKCEFEAICEGDDYWIDSQKLQKQVNVMENNPDIMLCGTNGVILWENYANRAIVFNSFNENHKLSASEIIGKWIFPTAGLLYNVNLMSKWPEWTKEIYSSDLLIVLLAMARGGVYAIKDISCVYRCDKNGNSVSFNTRRETVVRNHISLYKNFNDFTSGKYNNLILPHINSLNNELNFIEAQKRSIILAFFVSPKRSIKNIFEHLFRMISNKFIHTKKTMV